ncbi:hypothetical protein OCAE111667_07485 [Occultella aeris]|uniref:Uncharacterized protein n=1 Tax=Occultella aeris TaxID=2761496 RepID=A0A7M4DPC7_9MICO|nr:hypothetical protein [Occultella aeris]VZO39313.1 hypothetical protein HALOF300_04009 [Occultella aeris]
MTATAPQWARAAQRMTRASLVSVAWFWAICVIAAAVVTLVLDWRMGEPPFSIMSTIRYGGIWYPFSVALIVVTATINVHVAAGMTRRSFVIGALISNVVIGVVNGVVMTAVLVIERGIYLDQGWSFAATSAAPIPSAWGVSLVFHCVMFVAGGLSGVLVGLTYYRWGAWATAALPLTVLPPIIASGLDPAALTVAVIAATTAATAVASYAMARTIAIRKPLEMS